ncbi:MAG: hypothetical protein JJE22_12785 [Bacteroidia bacterium]|nr:hypothetical protein [Bacteroidia bacterium]
MQKFILWFLIFSISKVYSQNEFAATAFYNDFKKIIADAQEGFPKYKGSKIRGTIADEYRVKLLLPLADSGRIVSPLAGNPFAEYYFQTTKTKKEIDQRSVNLREAVLTAYGKQLYARTETSTVKESIFSNTVYYANPDDNLSTQAIFKSRIYNFNGRYHLTFQVFGKEE